MVPAAIFTLYFFAKFATNSIGAPPSFGVGKSTYLCETPVVKNSGKTIKSSFLLPFSFTKFSIIVLTFLNFYQFHLILAQTVCLKFLPLKNSFVHLF